MELLRKYIEEVKQDLKIDDFNIKEVSLKLPSRKHFWVARLIDAKVERDKLIKQKKDLKKEVVQDVIRKYPTKLSIRDAENVAENHETINMLTEKIQEFNLIIEYLEKVEKIFSQTGFDIKNIIELQKMEQM